jgi:hypothetical protein
MRCLVVTFAAFSIGLWLSSCVTMKPHVDVASVRDNDSIRHRYSKILIYMEGGQIGLEKAMENAMSASLSRFFPGQTFAVTFSALFPPISRERVFGYGRKNGYDGVLIAGITEADLIKGGSTTSGHADVDYDGELHYSESTRTRSSLTAAYEIQLFDLDGLKPIWTCQVRTTAVTTSETEDLEVNVSEAICKELAGSDLIGAHAIQEPLKNPFDDLAPK